MQTLLCILQMDNRNGIMILSMLLVEGFSNTKKRLLFADVNAEQGSRVIKLGKSKILFINR